MIFTPITLASDVGLLYYLWRTAKAAPLGRLGTPAAEATALRLPICTTTVRTKKNGPPTSLTRIMEDRL